MTQMDWLWGREVVSVPPGNICRGVCVYTYTTILTPPCLPLKLISFYQALPW